MNEHRYILEKYNGKDSRHTCPECEKPNQFSKYIDTETNIVLGDNIGRCNRVDKCGYHKKPPLETKCYFVLIQDVIDYSEKAYKIKVNEVDYFIPKSQVHEITGKGCYISDYILMDIKAPPYIETDYRYFDSNGVNTGSIEAKTPKPQHHHQPISFIDNEVFNSSMTDYDNNNLIKYLSKLFDAETIEYLINIYKIGTSSRYNGGTTVFWQIDSNDNVRTGKLIKYDNTGHRIKGCNNWVHSVLNIDNYNLKQCFFGEHILKEAPNDTVAIVESEKTAIIAFAYLPNYIWLASGGADGINDEKVKILKGRKVILFPDASKDSVIYQKWKAKADKYNFDISDYIEKIATIEQKVKGYDIADFLSLENNKPKEIKHIEPIQKKVETNEVLTETPYNTPSPAALIDSKIENPPKFDGAELVVKGRLFTSISGDKIELVGVRDYGFCGNWENHKQAKGYCKPCLLNCVHTLKINGKLQSREFTQLEVLIMSNNKNSINKSNKKQNDRN